MIRFGRGHLIETLVATATCTNCGEPFGDDGGVVWPAKSGPPVAVHRECMIRMVMGGVNHQRGLCTCCGGTEWPDPPSLSTREAARVAWMYYRLHNKDATCPTTDTTRSS